MNLVELVVKKRSDSGTQKQDAETLKRFGTRVGKLRGEGLDRANEPEVTLEVVSINIHDIEIPPHYSRKSLGDVSSLVASIKVYGIQQPLKVVKMKGSKKFRLVFGRRRMKAAEISGLDAVPCIVELVTREDRLQMLSLAENIQRAPLTAIEEGETYKSLLDQNMAPEELSKNLGVTVATVQETIEILSSLPTAVQKEILNHPERFPGDLLKVLAECFRTSKVHGKKLFSAIGSGEVTTSADAKAFISRL